MENFALKETDVRSYSYDLYQVWMTNFGYFIDRDFYSLETAKEAGKESGFEYQILLNGDILK
jgi:hypothetical protein|tara:strand:+ start:43 stop:228 length:186 start_codon:yes stop_codon:yes gene_type:complete